MRSKPAAASSSSDRGTHPPRGGPRKTERPQSLHRNDRSTIKSPAATVAAAGPDKAGRPRSQPPTPPRPLTTAHLDHLTGGHSSDKRASAVRRVRRLHPPTSSRQPWRDLECCFAPQAAPVLSGLEAMGSACSDVVVSCTELLSPAEGKRASASPQLTAPSLYPSPSASSRGCHRLCHVRVLRSCLGCTRRDLPHASAPLRGSDRQPHRPGAEPGVGLEHSPGQQQAIGKRSSDDREGCSRRCVLFARNTPLA